jgi:hypothetical protein
MLLEAETNKYCPGGYDIGAISNLITWVLNFFFECIFTGESSYRIGSQRLTVEPIALFVENIRKYST